MEPTALIAYLKSRVDLTNDEVRTILAHIQVRTYLKGQYIVQQGDICRFESFVLSGCAKTFFSDSDGNEHVVMFAVEDWWTADLGSFITQQPADYNVQCLEKTVVAQISYEGLEKLYAEVPKLERFFRIIMQNAYVASQKRVVRNLSMPARERYLLFKKQYPSIEQRVPQYLIASYLGITKQFLSKIRAELILGD